MFFKSSFCEASACIEVSFAKSSFCESNTCVEVERGDTVQVRNSANPDVVVSFSREEWAAFVAGMKNGEFDL